MTSGIYCIENKINNNKYIGKSINIEKRWAKHLSKLRKKNHENDYLQQSWNKHKEENFIFYIIEECEKEELSEKEIFYINEFSSKSPNGYNLTDGGDGRSGSKSSLETRKKISEYNKNLFLDKTKHPMFGKIHSEESKEKMSKSQINSMTPSRRKKMSESAKGNKSHLGKSHSEKTKEILSYKNIGSKHKNSKSKYFGVAYDSYNEKWLASIWIEKKVYLGRFKDEIMAAKSYDEKCFEVYKDKSKLNFPEDFSL